MQDQLKLLAGFVVVDLGRGMATALVSKFMTDNGAQVIKVDQEGEEYFYDYYPAYSVWHQNSERADEATRDPPLLDRLLSQADACIVGGESYPTITADYDAEELSRNHPGLVVLEISGNPHGTPDYDRPSTDLLAQARTGLCYEQYTDKPIAMAFEPANYGAALQGICGLLAALYERNASGEGQVVRTSLFEGALTWVMQLWADFENPKKDSFVQPKDLTPLIFKCADEVYIHIVMGSAGSKYKLYKVLGIHDPGVQPGDSGMPDPTNPNRRHFFGDVDLLEKHVRKFESKALLEALWAEGLPVEQVYEPVEYWENPQVKYNGLIKENEDGLRHIGNPVIARAQPANWEMHKKYSDKPLNGLNIVDFGAYVAGPLGTRILSDLGADVTKVEPVNGDPSRVLMRSFMASNRGKRGISLDLKSAKPIIEKIVRNADAVTNNFRSGVPERLGIDSETLHQIKKELITLDSPGYGSTGPLAGQAAFDLIMQALCGHEAKAAGEGNPPFWNRTYMVDFAGGMLGAVALLAAINYRAKTGNGVSLEVPLLNAGVFLQSEIIQGPDGTIMGARRPNKTMTGYVPNESLYKAKDGWLAIVARSEAQRASLAKNLGLDSALNISHCWGDVEAEWIAKAVSEFTVSELVEKLEKAGIWVEPCRKTAEREILNDPVFQARGTVQVTQHPVYGKVVDIGSLVTFSRSSCGSDAYIHNLGEHTKAVLRELNFDDCEIETFLEHGLAGGMAHRA